MDDQKQDPQYAEYVDNTPIGWEHIKGMRPYNEYAGQETDEETPIVQ